VRDQKENQWRNGVLDHRETSCLPCSISEAFFIPTTLFITRLYTNIIDGEREKRQFQKNHNQIQAEHGHDNANQLDELSIAKAGFEVFSTGLVMSRSKFLKGFSSEISLFEIVA